MNSNNQQQSVRTYLKHLQERGDIHTVTEAVSTRYEISAYLTALTEGPAVLFDKVQGHDMPVFGNLLNSLERIAAGLNTSVDLMQRKIVAAIRNPIANRIVVDAPCQEVIEDNPDLTQAIPAPWFFEHETGAYITAGCIIAKDSRSGAENMSYARLKLLGGNRAMIGIAPNHHLSVIARNAKARGENLDIAICIGNHPAVMIAGALYLGLGDYELEVAGALIDEPIEVVNCHSIPLQVPAHCELVLEGTLDIDDTIEEGLVSEYHGMYENYGCGAMVTVNCLARRSDALFQVIQPGYNPEHLLIGGVPIAAGLFHYLQSAIPNIREVAVGKGGAGRVNAVITLKDPTPELARQTIQATWDAVNIIKQVTVTEDNIDPWNPEQVEFAVASRVRADRDLMIVPAARADRSEPLERQGKVTKLGIDATRNPEDRDDWRLAVPPAEIMQAVLNKLGLDGN